MAVDFAKEFIRSGGLPIQWEGRTLHSHLLLNGRIGDLLEISFLRFAESPVQGLSISSGQRNFEMECAGVRGRRFVVWTDTAPKHTSIRIIKPVRTTAPISVRNIWRDEKYGTTMYGLNAAAFQVEDQAPNEYILRCSDGWLGPDFNDLVVLIRLVHRGAVAETQ